MRTFVLVIFWSLVACAFLKAFVIQIAHYPRRTTLTSDIIGLIEGIALAVWAAIVLWVLK